MGNSSPSSAGTFRCFPVCLEMMRTTAYKNQRIIRKLASSDERSYRRCRRVHLESIHSSTPTMSGKSSVHPSLLKCYQTSLQCMIDRLPRHIVRILPYFSRSSVVISHVFLHYLYFSHSYPKIQHPLPQVSKYIAITSLL